MAQLLHPLIGRRHRVPGEVHLGAVLRLEAQPPEAERVEPALDEVRARGSRCRWTSRSSGPTDAGGRRGPRSTRPRARRRPRTARSRPRGAGTAGRCRPCGCRSARRGTSSTSPSTRCASRGTPRPTGSAISSGGRGRRPSTGRSRPGAACAGRSRDRGGPRGGSRACCRRACRSPRSSRRRSRRTRCRRRRRGPCRSSIFGEVDHLLDVLGRLRVPVGGAGSPAPCASSNTASVYFSAISARGEPLVLHRELHLVDGLGGGFVGHVPDVGDVHDLRHLEALELERAADQVVEHEAPQVPEVGVAVDRRTAGVHLHVPRLDGHDVLDPTRERVEQPHRHRIVAAGRSPRFRGGRGGPRRGSTARSSSSCATPAFSRRRRISSSRSLVLRVRTFRT